MSTLRVSNIEAKADPSSPTVNEKVKITNSNGDVMLQLDGATSGITTVGINTTTAAFTVDGDQNFNFVGVVTAASLSGNLTGNVTGNADTATTATNALGLSTSQLNIGSSFVNANAIGIGSTDTAGRNAGVGTANGTIIFNAETYALEVFGSVAGWETVKQLNNFLVNVPVSNTSTDTASRSGYTVITYTGPGSFDITAGTKTIEYLVVAGGGSGGGGIPTYAGGGGGGAGGFRTGSWTGGAGENYTITVGGGGSPSSLVGPGIAITSARGGVGGVWSGGSVGPGGSGGGGVNNAEAGGAGNVPSTSPPQGNPGGNGTPYTGGSGSSCGGGGGAGAPGGNGSGGTAGVGGAGSPSSITGSPVFYAGGGGGGGNPGSAGGQGGGGAGGSGSGNGTAGTVSTGGGGGGGGSPGGGSTSGGLGGSGVVIIAYET